MKTRTQFRLRTLMIAVTVFCVVIGGYVGWQAKIVRERLQILRRVETLDSGLVTCESTPFLRRILGDQSVTLLVLPLDTSVQERRTIHKAFPEALIIGYRMEPVDGKVQSRTFSLFSDYPGDHGRD